MLYFLYQFPVLGTELDTHSATQQIKLVDRFFAQIFLSHSGDFGLVPDDSKRL